MQSHTQIILFAIYSFFTEFYIYTYSIASREMNFHFWFIKCLHLMSAALYQLILRMEFMQLFRISFWHAGACTCSCILCKRYRCRSKKYKKRSCSAYDALSWIHSTFQQNTSEIIKHSNTNLNNQMSAAYCSIYIVKKI